MHTLFDTTAETAVATRLYHIVSPETLRSTHHILLGLTTITAGAGSFLYWQTSDNPWSEPLLGVASLSAAAWLGSFALYCYLNAHYFYGIRSLIGLTDNPITGSTFEVTDIIARQPDDVTASFVQHTLGREVLRRSGLPDAVCDAYLATQRPRLSTGMIPVSPNTVFTMFNLGLYLLQQDKTFTQLLNTHGITPETFLGSLQWVSGRTLGQKHAARWWGKDNLSQTTGIGREWSYGHTYYLDRFVKSITTSAVYSVLSNTPYAEEKVSEIESVLARNKASNVLLIGEAGVGKIDLMIAIKRRLANGTALTALTDKHIVVLDTRRLLAIAQDKGALENLLLSLLTEATNAGNIVLVIENISTFIKEGQALEVYIPELLDEFLAHPDLHIVATDTPGNFHATLQPLGGFVRRFAEILIEPPDRTSTVRLLQGIAETHEHRHHVLFTYKAVDAIAATADQYIVDGVMPDKAITLLVSVADQAAARGETTITDDLVYEVVSQLTGFPIGPISDQERDQFLHLEDRLHERVIGQDQAIAAVARTLRRARAGIQAADRPIGSFLFLGPTGVGKTETAKALAHVVFGSEAEMRRLDMSEFSGPDALERLIGNNEQAGALANLLQEHPYTVLLLDEFEKAAQPVHDLFLQILDEGIFTDGRGQKVNARNTIIIATSNAGSQLIISTVEQRQALATLHDKIIDHIIAEGVYRPELINRFDNTIIFEPLTKEEQGGVASLILQGLYERIKERGYDLAVSRDLIDVLVEKGYDPQFGARPMQRVVQDLLEEKIAQKIIAGEVQKGDTISLDRTDFTAEELLV